MVSGVKLHLVAKKLKEPNTIQVVKIHMMQLMKRIEPKLLNHNDCGKWPAVQWSWPLYYICREEIRSPVTIGWQIIGHMNVVLARIQRIVIDLKMLKEKKIVSIINQEKEGKNKFIEAKWGLRLKNKTRSNCVAKEKNERNILIVNYERKQNKKRIETKTK